ncbi:MAG: hypothetical protein J6M66_09865 [Lachnospiraceae bacterium]|nr:hypothetical protein [Lachnospiraceae bacterium]
MSELDHIEKDLRRADVQESAGVPDEVLRQMIREIEEGGMLRAPGYLKREIMDAAEKSDATRIMDAAEKSDATGMPGTIPVDRLSSDETRERERHASGTLAGAKTGVRNKRRNRIAQKLEWIGYALEVGAVTAAAVALVFMIPDDDRLLGERRDVQEANKWGFRYDEQWEQENELRQQISDATSDLTRKIVTWGSFLLPGEEEDMR